jgi:predicted RNA binding protein YcfA (HicA-like mRNA interferase family)
MPPFKPIKRLELIRQLKKFGFSEPKSGGSHQYMVKGELKLFIPALQTLRGIM